MKLKLVIYIFLIVVALLISLVAVSEIFDLSSTPNEFVFGTEVGGFKYASKANFLIFNCVQLLIGMGIFIFTLVKLFKGKQ